MKTKDSLDRISSFHKKTEFVRYKPEGIPNKEKDILRPIPESIQSEIIRRQVYIANNYSPILPNPDIYAMQKPRAVNKRGRLGAFGGTPKQKGEDWTSDFERFRTFLELK